MNNSKNILTSVLKTTQKGQTEIRSVLDLSIRPGLRKALESQLREYNTIENEAHAIASQRGWELSELDPAVRFFSDVLMRMKLTKGNCDSQIADIMIHRNTRNMVQGLKNLHQFPKPDDPVSILSQKLLDCETANIRQMQSYL